MTSIFNSPIPSVNYRPDIDGLRAVAVLAVLLHHLSYSLLPGGYVGVDIFFVISGFLITNIINREITEGRFTFKRFYQRRARRIFPALFVVIAVTMLVSYYLLLPSDYAAMLRAVLGTIFFSSNVVFYRELIFGYFAGTGAKLNPLLHTWSLGVEEQFYLIFPILLLICDRYVSRYVFWILFACALFTLAATEILVKHHAVAVFFLSPFRGWELLAGAMLVYKIVPDPRNQILREALSMCGLLAILIASFKFNDSTVFPGVAALLPVLGSVAIIHAGSSGSTMVGRMLQYKPVVYIGLISYSLYLWHWPLIVLTQYAVGMESLTPYLPILFTGSLLLASLSYHFIEQPFRCAGTVTRQNLYLLTVSISIVLVFVSVSGLVKDGFSNRFDAKVIELDKARNPSIQFVSCDSRAEKSWCKLGALNTVPTVLVWGDSHALAWATVLNSSLRDLGLSASFANISACPPLLQVDSSVVPSCREHNEDVMRFLSGHPEVTTVIMSAYWSKYFREESEISFKNGSGDERGIVGARRALATTLLWLRENGKQIVLIGPVPVYDKSVPLMLALEAQAPRNLLSSNAAEQFHKNAPFFEEIHAIQNLENFRFLDPIEWMCTPSCEMTKDGLSLYRDSNHLNITGAMAFKPFIEAALSKTDD